MSKKKKVEKVSKETGVEEKALDRLPVEALDKLDDLVPDEIDIFAETEEAPAQEEVPVVVEVKADVEKKLVGRHPITKEPVYL